MFLVNPGGASFFRTGRNLDADGVCCLCSFISWWGTSWIGRLSPSLSLSLSLSLSACVLSHPLLALLLMQVDSLQHRQAVLRLTSGTPSASARSASPRGSRSDAQSTPYQGAQLAPPIMHTPLSAGAAPSRLQQLQRQYDSPLATVAPRTAAPVSASDKPSPAIAASAANSSPASAHAENRVTEVGKDRQLMSCVVYWVFLSWRLVDCAL